MMMIEAHQKRLDAIDEEIQRIDVEIQALTRQRRGNPGSGAAEAAQLARKRRQDYLEEREEIASDIAALLKLERSEARVKQRAHARETLKAATEATKHRQQLAASLDRAANAFLAVLDELVTLGNATQSAVREAAQTAVPFHSGFVDASGFRDLGDQRMLLIEATGPHAGAFTGPDMKFALVLFLDEVIRRVDNPKSVAEISGGWQYTPGETTYTFAEAAQRAHERLSFGAQRIELCLQEPT